jgi:hypothetical protein
MDNKKILLWEMFGILFIFLIGAFLHFTYELSGGLRPLALISAVNESVWEHLKIAFWPAFVWGIIEFFTIRKKVKNFFFAKAVSFLLIPVIIVAVFYSYTYFIGSSILAVDITTFFVSIAVAQIVGYRLMLIRKSYPALNILGAVLIIVMLAAFSWLTFHPPKIFLFKDPEGNYGILKK